jgi:hypothetical protein
VACINNFCSMGTQNNALGSFLLQEMGKTDKGQKLAEKIKHHKKLNFFEMAGLKKQIGSVGLNALKQLDSQF